MHMSNLNRYIHHDQCMVNDTLRPYRCDKIMMTSDIIS